MHIEKQANTSPRNEQQTRDARKPWETPTLETLAVNETENGNTNPSGDLFTLS